MDRQLPGTDFDELTDEPMHQMAADEQELEHGPLSPGLTPHETNPFVHIYRGEMSRLTAYRARIDTTTNWALSTSAALTTFTLSNEAIPHRFFLFIASLHLVFIWMEARRYVNYELVSRRCRLLEAGMYGNLLGNKDTVVDWKRQLGHAYGPNPHLFPLRSSILLRFRRAHLWLSWIIFFTWVFKISLLQSFPWMMLLGVSIFMVVASAAILLFPMPKWVDV